MLKKHFLKILIGCLISAVLIYLALKDINWKELVEYIKDTNYYLLILAFVLSTITYFARSFRYHYIILPIKKTRIFENFPYLILGFFMNNVIPLRLGEFVRAKITGERLGISRSATLATIVVERLFDIITYVIFFLLIANVLPFPDFIKGSFIFCAIFFGIMLVVLFFISLYVDKSVSILSKFPLPAKVKDFAISLIHKFIDGLVILKSKKAFIISFLMSFAVWTIESSAFVVTAYACGFSLTIYEGIFVVIIIGVSGIIPTAPGYMGAFEWAGLVSLTSLGVNETQAIACVIIYHVYTLLLNFILAGISIVKAKISFKDLFNFEEIPEKKNV